jgi:hypothetical protein
VFINITLKDLIEKPETPAPSPEEVGGEETPEGGEEIGEEETPEASAPEEEELYINEAVDEQDPNKQIDLHPDEMHNIKSKIETAYIKMTKYDYETNKKLGEFEDNIKTKDLFNVTWLLHKFKDVDKYTLKIPNNQQDVDKTKKHLKNFRDIHYE